MTLHAKFIDAGRAPNSPPNPHYPHGIDVNVDLVVGKPRCMMALFPARCGVWMVRCDLCGYVAAITAAGRIDDPRSVTLPCRGN
jgi:hypothetical protein